MRLFFWKKRRRCRSATSLFFLKKQLPSLCSSRLTSRTEQASCIQHAPHWRPEPRLVASWRLRVFGLNLRFGDRVCGAVALFRVPFKIKKKQMPSRRSSHGLLSDLRIATAGKGRAVGLSASCRVAPRTEQASRMRDEPKGRMGEAFSGPALSLQFVHFQRKTLRLLPPRLMMTFAFAAVSNLARPAQRSEARLQANKS